MDTPPIIVVGTPQGFWTQWVDRFLARLEHTRIHSDLQSSKALDGVLCERTESNALVLVEHPAVGLGRVLSEDANTDPHGWLDEWLASGRALLAHALRHPEACVLVNADDARRDPHKLAALMHSRWGESFEPPGDASPACTSDPLANALAWSFVERHLPVQDLADELLARCVILPGDESSVPMPGPRNAVDAVASSRRLSQLLRAERCLEETRRDAKAETQSLRGEIDAARVLIDALTAENAEHRAASEGAQRREVALARDLDRARAEAEAQADRLAQTQRLLEQASGQRTRVEHELRIVSEERDVLAQGLERTREELRSAVRARCDAQAESVALRSEFEAQAGLASQARQQASQMQAELETLKAELESIGARCTRIERESQDARDESETLLLQLHETQEALERSYLERRATEVALAELKAAAPDGKRLERALRTAHEERELLTLQMDQIQRELERVHAERLSLARDASAAVLLPGFDDVAIGEMEVTGERDTPPHRELSFVIRDVRTGDRRIAETTVRLVEHWGRPGLAIFVDEGSAPLLAAWAESGREDGRPYALLVHGEEPAQRAFASMGSLDWHLVQALVLRMQRALSAQDLDVSRAWRSLALRLDTGLQDQAARLRHEAIRVVPISQESPELARWGLELERASYRGRVWPRLAIRWRPVAPRASIELLYDDESGAPLMAWPMEEDGTPARVLRLPIGPEATAPDGRAGWDALCPADKEFVIEVVARLPTLSEHIQASMGEAASIGGVPIDLQAAAREAVQHARAAMTPVQAAPEAAPAGRRWLQRLARRVRFATLASGSAAPSEATR